MKTVINVIMVFVLFTPVVEAGIKNKAKTRRYADEIIATVAQGNIRGAFEKAKKHWPLSEKELDNLSQKTVSQLNQIAPRFGDIVGKEFIRKEEVGKSFLRYQYIVKYEKHAVRWNMLFYKPEDEWFLNRINWDDQVEKLFN